MAITTLNIKFTVLPQVNPGDGARAFSGVSKTGIVEVAPTLASQGIGSSPTTTTSSTDDWHGLSVGTSVPSLLSKDNLKKIDNVIKQLKTAADLLAKIASLIELILSSFGSLGQILNTILTVIQGQINTWIKDLSGVGLYFIPIVPPAYLQMLEDVKKLKINELGSGGFQNFLSTLGASFYNSADKNKPVFSDEAMITGFIILIDADTLDQFFTTMLTFSKMFNFMDLLSINIKPAAPKNIRGVLKYDKNKKAYGVSLTWDGPSTYVPEYKVSRSMVPGGRPGKADIDITTLKLYDTVKDQWNVFTAIKYFIKNKGKWPQIDVKYYDDLEAITLGVPPFDGPAIVAANPLTSGGTYTDYNIKVDSNGKPARATYHYVIQGGLGSTFGIWSPMSNDVPVHVSPPCLSPDDAATVLHQTPQGRQFISFINSGYAGLGRWSSVKLSVPFIADFAKMFNQIIGTLKGMTANVSSSFSAFIKSIVDKIDYYANLIQALIAIIEVLESLVFSGRVGYLYLPLKGGGVPGFMSRLRAAKPLSYQDPATKETVTGFSGPSGITAGMVFLTGTPGFDNTVTTELSDELNAAVAMVANTAGVINPAFKTKINSLYAKEYQKALDAKNQAYQTIVKIFTSIFGG